MIINKNLQLLPYKVSFNESSELLGHRVYIYIYIFKSNIISRNNIR